jgi:25S rRNA (adenine2142-N1)-methyltransferase
MGLRKKLRKPVTLEFKKSSAEGVRIKSTQKVISEYHTLMKRLSLLESSDISAGSSDEIFKIQERLKELGGLEGYQKASLKGGNKKQGFFKTCQFLLPFLKSIRNSISSDVTDMTTGNSTKSTKENNVPKNIKLLDVGALDGQTFVKIPWIQCTSIDLNPQSHLVKKQDFFDRPLPKTDQDRFHVICMALVINFVPSAQKRGDMLLRCRDFLLETGLVYIVLPSP